VCVTPREREGMKRWEKRAKKKKNSDHTLPKSNKKVEIEGIIRRDCRNPLRREKRHRKQKEKRGKRKRQKGERSGRGKGTKTPVPLLAPHTTGQRGKENYGFGGLKSVPKKKVT